MLNQLVVINKSFKPSVLHYYSASRDTFHKTQGAKIFYGVFVFGPVLFFLVSLASGSHLDTLVIADLPLWFFVVLLLSYPSVLLPLFQYLHLRNSFYANKSAQKEQHYSFSAEKLQNFGEGFHQEMSWRDVARIETSKHYVLFYVSSGLAHYIPRIKISETELNQIERWFRNAN